LTARTIYFISDQTGITAETLGKSLLTQFAELEFKQVTIPFINNQDKAHAAVKDIQRMALSDGLQAFVFSTMVQDDLRKIFNQEFRKDLVLYMDFFDAFIAPMERALGVESSHQEGRAHGADTPAYSQRIDAINFALANDDGVRTDHYADADVILVGVSRSGKTPTCLFLALQYGIYAANYPLADENFEQLQIPAALKEHKNKIYGLNIEAMRLAQIRSERRPNSRYASLAQVNYEVRQADAIFRKLNINSTDTTHASVEEIASIILQSTDLKRRI
jgi:regulator of PEP synthase PpsR (kinase-PPPase family)